MTADPNIEHLHNQLIAGIFANVGRDLPEPGVAPWVSANDKPTVLAKPVSGDAAEQRLKTEIMRLPARDRRRLKEVSDVSGGSLLKHISSSFLTMACLGSSIGKHTLMRGFFQNRARRLTMFPTQ